MPDVNSVKLPNVPPDTYERLTKVANAIDTANGHFSTHAGSLAHIHQETNGAVTNATTDSKGAASTTLADTWKDTQTDLNRSHDPLTSIIASNCMGGTPNPLQSALDQNKTAIQDGLVAMVNIQALKRDAQAIAATAQQVSQ
jgi:hypothetical protein